MNVGHKKRHELSINLQFDQKVEPIVENSLEHFDQQWLTNNQIQEWSDSGYNDMMI